MKLAVVDNGGANIASVIYALEDIGAKPIFTDDPKTILESDRVLLPGVGSAKAAMEGLKKKGLVDTLKELTQPVMGICLGMQLLFDRSEEGDAEMLGLIPGPITHFKEKPGKTIPHMGWNNIDVLSDHPLMHKIKQGEYFYFVHSFRADHNDHTLGKCDYDGEVFSAIVAKDNVMGCQFHPERSGQAGRQILKNFMEITS